MSTIGKSLLALDDFLANASKNELEKIWLEVKEMEFEGPTIEEFFTFAIEGNPINFKLQEGVELLSNTKPPDLGSFKRIKETPKFSLESFFL